LTDTLDEEASASVGVVIPVFNRRLRLTKTLESVAAQSVKPALVVVVDDGSNDGTGDEARKWLAAHACFEWRVLAQNNMGPSAARNLGFSEIRKVPYVCFLDSDDLWPPDFLERGVEALASRADAVAAVANKVKEGDIKRGEIRDHSSISENPLAWVFCNTGALLSCSIIRSSAAQEAGLFVPGMASSEDLDFFLRLFQVGPAVHSKSQPVRFRKGSKLENQEAGNLSRHTPEREYSWAQYRTNVLAKLPRQFLQSHATEIRTVIASQWAEAAFSNWRTRNRRLALRCLFNSIWWDHDVERRGALLWHFFRGRKEILAAFHFKKGVTP
jgi:glycosyltransferase involved in cell wall biosynthesis